MVLRHARVLPTATLHGVITQKSRGFIYFLCLTMHIFKSEKNVVSEQDNTFSAFKGLTCAVRSNTTI